MTTYRRTALLPDRSLFATFSSCRMSKLRDLYSHSWRPMPGVLSAPLAIALVATLQNPSPPSRDTVPADRHAAAPTIRATRVHGTIEVDGRLDESSWAGAQPASDFTQTEPAEGRPATERTEVRVLIGEDALYLGARLHDREPGRIKAALARRDEDVEADEFDVYLDTFHAAERGRGEGELLAELVRGGKAGRR